MPLPQNSAEAVKAIQDYGQQQYRQSNYVEALEAFSKVCVLLCSCAYANHSSDLAARHSNLLPVTE